VHFNKRYSLITSFIFIAFASIVVIQLIIWLFIFLRLGYYQNDKSSHDPLPISIVISAHDELENLKELIPILTSQQYSQYEIIVVEDRSNDDTYDFLLTETKQNSKVRIVKVDSLPSGVNGKKYALTLGIKAAKYDNILFTDADCRPNSPLWLEEMQKGFQEGKEIVLGFSPYIRKRGLLNLFIRFETIYSAIQYLSLALVGLPYMGVGRNLAYKRSLFLKNKGFNNHIRVMGGDDDLFVNENANKKNVTIVINPDAKVYSLPKTTWKEWYTQKKRHLSVGKRYKFKFKFILGLLAFLQIFFWIFFILAIILTPYKIITLGLFFAKALVMVIVYLIILKKLDEKLPLGLLPFLDFIYSFYFVTIGASALFSKKNRWK